MRAKWRKEQHSIYCCQCDRYDFPQLAAGKGFTEPSNKMNNKKKYKKVKVLIITGFGLNCEAETSAAFNYCGASAKQIHLNDILAGKHSPEEFHILVFIGGFSFGDHLGAGTVFANRVKFRMRDSVEKFITDGKLVIGICNGFQTLTRLGLVPALDKKYFIQQTALAHNDSGVFRDDWVWLKANPKSPCIFTKGIDRIFLPVRHGEGKFAAEDRIIKEIEEKNLTALKYCDSDGNTNCAFPCNPNGSIKNIAGICDPTGRIFGLMPHPEAYLSPYNSPRWTHEKLKGKLPGEGQGVAIFRNAVEFAAKNLL